MACITESGWGTLQINVRLFTMASIKKASSLLTSADGQWTSQPVVFHNNHGKNIELSQNNTVATRVRDYNHGIVCTSEPVSIGQMFKVTVLEKECQWAGGFVSVQYLYNTIPYQ